MRVEVLYNKAEIHSINTSKGDTADVGVFSDNAEVTVYEFLDAAEIAYLGWGNSVQKANRLYNRHLSEEIKSKLINKSDSYAEMKQWLSVSCLAKANWLQTTVKANLLSTPTYLELCRGWKDSLR